MLLSKKILKTNVNSFFLSPQNIPSYLIFSHKLWVFSQFFWVHFTLICLAKVSLIAFAVGITSTSRSPTAYLQRTNSNIKTINGTRMATSGTQTYTRTNWGTNDSKSSQYSGQKHWVSGLRPAWLSKARISSTKLVLNLDHTCIVLLTDTCTTLLPSYCQQDFSCVNDPNKNAQGERRSRCQKKPHLEDQESKRKSARRPV